MRKSYFTFTLAFMLAMSAIISGCTEKKDMEFAPVDNGGYTLIEANIETLIFDAQDRVWPEDACIGVYGSEQGENECYIIKNASEGLKTATFYGPLVKGAIAAYYPYNPSYIGHSDGMPVSVSSEQKYNSENDAVTQFLAYTPRAFGYMQNDMVNFVYPNGLLHITIETYETLTIKKITLRSQTDRLAGLGIFGHGGTLEMTETAAYEVSLDCGKGVSSRQGDKFTDFYIVMVPGQYKGLEISLSLETDSPFVRILPPVEVSRISASDFIIASVTINPDGGPDDFTDTPVEFE